jgi:hypothetical protein
MVKFVKGKLKCAISCLCNFFSSDIKKKRYNRNTVKLGYNEFGYCELPLIANKTISLVGLGELT